MHGKLTIAALMTAIAWAQGPPGGGAGDGIWTRNAAFGEVETFDLCNGHQPKPECIIITSTRCACAPS